jgi:hypothetical protein
MRLSLDWTPVAGTADYHTADGWRAIYLRTVRGFGCYRIVRPNGSTYGTGGLPSSVVL